MSNSRYRATLNDLIQWCEEEGIKPDEPLYWATGPDESVVVVSVYRADETGIPWIDLEPEA